MASNCALRWIASVLVLIALQLSSCGNQDHIQSETPIVQVLDSAQSDIKIPSFTRLAGVLTTISCHGKSFCAVGGRTEINGATFPLLAVTKGAYWHASPQRVGLAMEISSISCWSQWHCIAVGPGPGPDLWEEEMTHWKAISSSEMDLGSKQPVYFEAVSCASKSFCVVVGNTASSISQPIIDVLDNSHWSSVTLPGRRSFGVVLRGVSCPNMESCVAVGNKVVGTQQFPYALVGSDLGTQWRSIEMPSAQPLGQLSDISCSSYSYCVAIGIDHGIHHHPGAADTQEYFQYVNGMFREGKVTLGSWGHRFTHSGLSALVTSVSCIPTDQCYVSLLRNANNVQDSMIIPLPRLGESIPHKVHVISTSQFIINAILCTRPNICIAAGGRSTSHN